MKLICLFFLLHCLKCTRLNFTSSFSLSFFLVCFFLYSFLPEKGKVPWVSMRKRNTPIRKYVAAPLLAYLALASHTDVLWVGFRDDPKNGRPARLLLLESLYRKCIPVFRPKRPRNHIWLIQGSTPLPGSFFSRCEILHIALTRRSLSDIWHLIKCTLGGLFVRCCIFFVAGKYRLGTVWLLNRTEGNTKKATKIIPT